MSTDVFTDVSELAMIEFPGYFLISPSPLLSFSVRLLLMRYTHAILNSVFLLIQLEYLSLLEGKKKISKHIQL